MLPMKNVSNAQPLPCTGFSFSHATINIILTFSSVSRHVKSWMPHRFINVRGKWLRYGFKIASRSRKTMNGKKRVVHTSCQSSGNTFSSTPVLASFSWVLLHSNIRSYSLQQPWVPKYLLHICLERERVRGEL